MHSLSRLEPSAIDFEELTSPTPEVVELADAIPLRPDVQEAALLFFQPSDQPEADAEALAIFSAEQSPAPPVDHRPEQPLDQLPVLPVDQVPAAIGGSPIDAAARVNAKRQGKRDSTILIVSADVLARWSSRAVVPTDLLVLADADADYALQVIERRCPQIVILEEKFASTSRGKAFVNHLQSMSVLAGLTIRVLPTERSAMLDTLGAITARELGSIAEPLARPVDQGVDGPTQRTLAPPDLPQKASGFRWLYVAIAVGLAALALGSISARNMVFRPIAPGVPELGRIVVTTDPRNADVMIDGKPQGTTPLSISLSPGDHQLAVRSGANERVVAFTVLPGREVEHYIQFSLARPSEPLASRMTITSNPTGSKVNVDGRPAGKTPITITDLKPGDHIFRITGKAGSISRTLKLEAGGDVSLDVSLPVNAGSSAGWLSIAAPVELKIVEGGDIVGSSGIARVMMAAGRHEITLVNEALPYNERYRIEIVPGKVTAIDVTQSLKPIDRKNQVE